MIRLAVFLLLLSFTQALSAPLVVTNDIGGRVDKRNAQIHKLYEQGRSVIIDGHCASSCTMYLAIGCVTERASLTFHGPSFYGFPLSPHDFEVWSQHIAAHYPEELRDWYLTTGRYLTQFSVPLGYQKLVRMGAKACPAGSFRDTHKG